MLDISQTVKRDDSAILRHIAGERLVVPISGDLAKMERVFTLNEIGEFIWSRLDGAASLGSIARAVAGEFDVDIVVAETDACEFVTTLHEQSLVRLVDA